MITFSCWAIAALAVTTAFVNARHNWRIAR